jgi:hypothetical protein
MELSAGSRILGARLMQQRGNVLGSEGTAAAPGSSAPVHLLLLTSSQLICYTFKGT